MKITVYEDEIKDAIVRYVKESTGKINLSHGDISLQNVGITSTKIIAEIEVVLGEKP